MARVEIAFINKLLLPTTYLVSTREGNVFTSVSFCSGRRRVGPSCSWPAHWPRTVDLLPTPNQELLTPRVRTVDLRAPPNQELLTPQSKNCWPTPHPNQELLTLQSKNCWSTSLPPSGPMTVDPSPERGVLKNTSSNGQFELHNDIHRKCTLSHSKFIWVVGTTMLGVLVAGVRLCARSTDVQLPVSSTSIKFSVCGKKKRNCKNAFWLYYNLYRTRCYCLKGVSSGNFVHKYDKEKRPWLKSLWHFIWEIICHKWLFLTIS